MSRSRPSSSVSRQPRSGWRRRTAWGQSRRAAERRCLRLAFGVVSAGAVCFESRPASSARSAASRGGWRRRRRPARQARAALERSAGLCSSRAGSRVFGGREHEIAEREPPPIYECASFRLQTPIYAMVASVQLLSMRSRSATIVWVLGAGPVSDAVPRSRTARRTALQTANGSWRFELASVKTLGASGVSIAAA